MSAYLAPKAAAPESTPVIRELVVIYFILSCAFSLLRFTICIHTLFHAFFRPTVPKMLKYAANFLSDRGLPQNCMGSVVTVDGQNPALP